MADIALTSYNNIGISIKPVLSTLPILSSNSYINSNTISILNIGILTELISTSNINIECVASTLLIGTTENLFATSLIQFNIESILILGTDEILINSIHCPTTINADMIIQIKCDNCKFNNERMLVKYSPRCYRTARYKNNKLNCNMYKYI